MKEYLVELKLRRILNLPENTEEAHQIVRGILGGLDLNKFSTEEPEVSIFTRKGNKNVTTTPEGTLRTLRAVTKPGDNDQGEKQ